MADVSRPEVRYANRTGLSRRCPLVLVSGSHEIRLIARRTRNEFRDLKDTVKNRKILVVIQIEKSAPSRGPSPRDGADFSSR